MPHRSRGITKNNGEDNPAARLTTADVRDIRRRRANMKPRERSKNPRNKVCVIAEEYGISTSQVCHIVARKRWQNVRDDQSDSVLLKETRQKFSPEVEARRQEAVRAKVSRLTENEVREIRRLYGPITGDGRSKALRLRPRPLMRELAIRFGVGVSTIENVVHRLSWKHVQ